MPKITKETIFAVVGGHTTSTDGEYIILDFSASKYMIRKYYLALSVSVHCF